MADAATMLLQDKSVLEFLKMLNGANRQSQANEYADFFSSVDAMQRQLNETLAELKNVRKQLDAIQDRKNPVRRAFTAVVDKLQAEVQTIQKQLNELKEKLITAAKNAVQNVKEQGLAALNGIFKFFGIKQELQATVKSAAEVIKSCNQSIAKIETVSREYHAVGLHTKNIGRAIAGKEAVTDQKQKGKLAKTLQAMVRFRRNFSNGLKKKCEAALAKLESLEKTVGLLRA
jgi:septal ring factor EnvC (AmiA/AmiB activator)